MESEKKTVRVAAAAILHGGKVLACQRGYGDLKGRWELPGGKIEPHETGMEAVQREIREELCMRVRPLKVLCPVEYDYPAFHLSMQVFLCVPGEGTMVLTEHESACWVAAGDLEKLPWCPADRQALPFLKEALEKSKGPDGTGIE